MTGRHCASACHRHYPKRVAGEVIDEIETRVVARRVVIVSLPVAIAKHPHVAERHFVIVREMVRDASPAEEMVARTFARAYGVKVTGRSAVSREKVAVGPSAILVDTPAISDVEIGIHLGAAVIDVTTYAPAAIGVDIELHAAIIAGLAVLLEYDVYDAGRALSGIF